MADSLGLRVQAPFGDTPLWGVKVLKFDGAIAPKVLRFDAPPARGLWWAPLNYKRRQII